MRSAKQLAREALDQLPDDCTWEDIQYRLYFLETLTRRIERADVGDFVEQAEVEQRISEWLAK
jgi:hypothetical protein